MGEAQKTIMMKGSEGKADYFPVARKGGVMLGVKLVLVSRGAVANVPDTTYFAWKLRSAYVVEPKQPGEVVVQLHPKPASLTVWAGVEWGKTSSSYCSTIAGVFVHGDPATTEGRQRLKAEIEEQKLAIKMTDYLIKVADGEGNLVTSRHEMRNWLDAAIQGITASVVASAEAKSKFGQVLQNTIGTIGVQASKLKEMYAALPDEVQEAPKKKFGHENVNDPDDDED